MLKNLKMYNSVYLPSYSPNFNHINKSRRIVEGRSSTESIIDEDVLILNFKRFYENVDEKFFKKNM